MGAVKAIVALLGKGFDLALSLFRAKNAPDVRAAEIAQRNANEKSRIEKAVGEKDVEETRKILGE